MNLDFFEEFEDKYLHTPCGQGYFLAGVLLGLVASHQAEGGYSSAPLFKVLQMGRMDVYNLKKHLSRVPTLVEAYDVPGKGRLYQLLNVALQKIAACGKDMGVDGNFAFTMGFVGAWDYYKKIFPDIEKNEQ